MSLVSFVLSRAPRFGVFVVVGWVGFALQLATLALLMSLAHWTWLPATIVAVELAVIHNFLWHERWTWGDRFARRAPSPESRVVSPEPRPARLARLVRFNTATGLTSIAGNVVLMALYVGVLGLPALAGNALAVVTLSVVNFCVADRWVFQVIKSSRPLRTSVSSVVAVLVFAAMCGAGSLASAAPRSETIDAWNRCVVDTELRLERAHASASPSSVEGGIRADGESIGVPSGTISRWRGSVFIPDVSLNDVLERLQHPGTPPPQEDVVSSRVISRGRDSLRVFIRLVRHAIVTATYDTEHEMTFQRRTPTLATARSVATRIEEVGGGDRGFLWRLNSYWRYEQVGRGVRVDLESLTLSRDVPFLIRPVAAPIVTRIARESTIRTLEALRAYFASSN